MHYVNDESLLIAKTLEQKFQKLPAELGILFISVRAHASETGVSSSFDVVLGLQKQQGFEYDTGYMLINSVLAEELETLKINKTVLFGIPGSAI